jgi:Holliday junction resolvase RusA-like endonuclease
VFVELVHTGRYVQCYAGKDVTYVRRYPTSENKYLKNSLSLQFDISVRFALEFMKKKQAEHILFVGVFFRDTVETA